MTTKMFESYFIQKTFRLDIIGNVWQILKIIDQKRFFWNISPIIEKIQKWTPKIKHSEI